MHPCVETNLNYQKRWLPRPTLRVCRGTDAIAVIDRLSICLTFRAWARKMARNVTPAPTLSNSTHLT